VPGVYTGLVDKIPMGAFMNKGLTMKTGQINIHKYLQPLLDRVQNGDIDPSFVITHTLSLEQAPHGYEIFKHKQDSCIKIVLKPGQIDQRSELTRIVLANRLWIRCWLCLQLVDIGIGSMRGMISFS
jgi:hypothetical protein